MNIRRRLAIKLSNIPMYKHNTKEIRRERLIICITTANLMQKIGESLSPAPVADEYFQRLAAYKRACAKYAKEFPELCI